MTGGRVGAAGARALALIAFLVAAPALAGCGQSGNAAGPALSDLPLVRGAQVVALARQCDRGANSFCALELVVVDDRYRTSTELLNAEHNLVHSMGWLGAGGDTGNQRAADSPGHKLRLTYATAYADLIGIDSGWIQRAHNIALALSRSLFNHTSAISVLLETGSG